MKTKCFLLAVAFATLLLTSTAAFAQQKGTFTDPRDKKNYKTVKIGNQTWMAENLNYDAKGSECYDNKPANCQKFGRLYNWDTALESCPSGWHLPSKSEWEVLDKAVGGEKVAGKKLKSKNGWNNNGNGTDEFGFSALPGGFFGSFNNIFLNVGDDGYWWSSSEERSYDAYYHGILYRGEDAYWNNGYKYYLLSVRCVRD